MFNDPVSFSGDTRVEVIAVLANCGRDTDKARRALVTWIRRKQDKGRSTEHILIKLRDIESKFIRDTTLHSAFRDARAETCLPRAPGLPLPSSIRRQSNSQIPESAPAVTTANSTGRASISSLVELRASPPVSPLRLSRDSSQMSDILPGKPNTCQWTPPAHGVPLVPHSRSPRIQIPRGPSLQLGPSSPITSSPEESEIHFRHRYRSQLMGSSFQSNGLVTPVSASPPEFPLSPFTPHDQAWRRSPQSFVPPPSSARIPCARSHRSVPISPPTSSSDESDFYPGRYRPISQPVGSPKSPGLRRVTQPRTSPPDVPLPPIPSDDQGADSDSDKSNKIPRAEQPLTPVQSLALHTATPLRPLPIQPIPSPVPGSDELEPADVIAENSLRQNWQESSGDLPSDIVVRQDSPVCAFHACHASPTGISPPPPYIDQLENYFPADMPTIDLSLERAVNECGDSSAVRLVVSKCIKFHRGYEPPYWQTHLQACGLDAETAKHLVDEMCKQVDWAASFRGGS